MDSTLRRSSRSFNDKRDFIRRKSRFTGLFRAASESRLFRRASKRLTTLRPLPYCTKRPCYLCSASRSRKPDNSGAINDPTDTSCPAPKGQGSRNSSLVACRWQNGRAISRYTETIIVHALREMTLERPAQKHFRKSFHIPLSAEEPLDLFRLRRASAISLGALAVLVTVKLTFTRSW